MPAPLVCYIRGLLQGKKITTTSLLRQFGYSHDSLTRFLSESFSWRSWYRFVVVHLFGILGGSGWIAIDDTVLAKPFGKVFPKACWVYDSCQKFHVFGYNLVMVVWSNGKVTIPLCWRWYRKHYKTKIEFAKSLLREVKVVWCIHPTRVLMDAFYVADDVVNLLNSYGWTWVGRIKKNRIVNGCRLDEDLIEEGDQTIGYIGKACKIKVVKYDHRYLGTNDLSLTKEDIPKEYLKRWCIEDTFRFLKQELHFAECQARSTKAQEKHLLCVCVGYLILQKERPTTETLYSLKEKFVFNQAWGYNRIKHYEAILTEGA